MCASGAQMGLGERTFVGSGYPGTDRDRKVRQAVGGGCSMSVLTTQKPPSRLRRMAWPVAGAAIAVGAAFYIRAVDPNNGGYPFCPLKYATGIDCPACGGLRCVYSLMNGDVGAAMDQNLLAVLVLPMVAIWAVFALVSLWRGDGESDPVRSTSNSADAAASASLNRAAAVRALIVTMIVFTVIFTILRNIPGVGYFPSGIG